jgi:hypothetical protein
VPLDLVVVRTEPENHTQHLPTYLRNAGELAAGLRRQAMSPETLRGYRADWARFERWVGLHGLDQLQDFLKLCSLAL